MDSLKDKLKDAEKYNAVVSVMDIDEQLKSERSGLLSEVSIALKDNISTKGFLTTASSQMLENYIPPFNATIVDKLKAEGALLVAKTTMDEFGMGGFGRTPITGVTLNPHNTERVSGGSSSGSAALVAAEVVDAAIGTDTGDSVRHPASYCGIVGFKPTYGAISRYGVIPFASSLDHVGVLAKDVQTAATVFEVIAGYDEKDMTSVQLDVENISKEITQEPTSKKIGVIKNVVDSINNKEIIQSFNELMANLEKVGYEVVEVELNQELFRLQNVLYQVISNAEAVSNLSNLDGVSFGNRQDGDTLEEIMINSRTEGFGPQVRERMLKGGYALLEENKEDVLFKAQKSRSMLVKDLRDQLNSVDFLMAPATGRIAPKIDDLDYDVDSDEHLIANNFMVMDNFSGHPGISIPMCLVDEMPVGVYISSKAFNDNELLKMAHIVENTVVI